MFTRHCSVKASVDERPPWNHISTCKVCSACWAYEGTPGSELPTPWIWRHFYLFKLGILQFSLLQYCDLYEICIWSFGWSKSISHIHFVFIRNLWLTALKNPWNFLIVDSEKGVSFVMLMGTFGGTWGWGLAAKGAQHVIRELECSVPLLSSHLREGRGWRGINLQCTMIPSTMTTWWSLHKNPKGHIPELRGWWTRGGAGRVEHLDGEEASSPFPHAVPYASLPWYESHPF